MIWFCHFHLPNPYSLNYPYLYSKIPTAAMNDNHDYLKNFARFYDMIYIGQRDPADKEYYRKQIGNTKEKYRRPVWARAGCSKQIWWKALTYTELKPAAPCWQNFSIKLIKKSITVSAAKASLIFISISVLIW